MKSHCINVDPIRTIAILDMDHATASTQHATYARSLGHTQTSETPVALYQPIRFGSDSTPGMSPRDDFSQCFHRRVQPRDRVPWRDRCTCHLIPT